MAILAWNSVSRDNASLFCGPECWDSKINLKLIIGEFVSVWLYHCFCVVNHIIRSCCNHTTHNKHKCSHTSDSDMSFSSITYSLYIYIEIYVLGWWTISALTRGLFWYLFPELLHNSGNKYQNNTRVSTETVRHEIHTLVYFLHDIRNP